MRGKRVLVREERRRRRRTRTANDDAIGITDDGSEVADKNTERTSGDAPLTSIHPALLPSQL